MTTDQGTGVGWGRGSGQGRDTSMDTVSHRGWPQGKVTGTPGRLFGHWWEKRKEAGGLAWAVAPPGTEDRREGKPLGGQGQGPRGEGTRRLVSITRRPVSPQKMFSSPNSQDLRT